MITSLSNELQNELEKQGWEFEDETEGIHFMMLTAENEGLGYDVFVNENSRSELDKYVLFSYTFDINREKEIEYDKEEYISEEKLKNIVMSVEDKGYDPNEFEDDIKNLMEEVCGMEV